MKGEYGSEITIQIFMKKIIGFMFVFLLGLSGCGNAQTTAEYSKDAERVTDATIEVWAPAGKNSDWLQYAVDAYNQEFSTNLQLEFTDVAPATAVGKVTPLLSAKQELPEIVFLNDVHFYSVYSEFPDAFVDLTAYGLGDDYMSNFPDKKIQILKNITDNGDIYGFPHAFTPTIVYYRDDLFKDAGIDYDTDINSMQDLIDAGDKIYEQSGVKMLGLMTPADAGMWSTLLQMQGEFFIKDGKFDLTSEASTKAANMTIDLMKDPATATYVTGDLGPTTTSSSSIVLSGSWWGGDNALRNPDQSGLWKAGLLPPFEEGGERYIPVDGGGAMYVSTSSDQAQAALQFLEWAYADPEVTGQGLTTGVPTANIAAYDSSFAGQKDPYYSDQVVTDIYRDAFNYIYDGVDYNFTQSDVTEIVGVELGKVMEGSQTVDEALAAAEEQATNTVTLPEQK